MLIGSRRLFFKNASRSLDRDFLLFKGFGFLKCLDEKKIKLTWHCQCKRVVFKSMIYAVNERELWLFR